MDGNSRPALRTDPGAVVVEEGDDAETARPESSVVRESRSEPAGSDDRHPADLVETEDRDQVPLERPDPIADPADAELAEGREVLADLR